MYRRAASGRIALAVDQAQYDDQEGPCLAAIDTASPVDLPEVAAAVQWPGFRDCAHRLGITTSLSIPLLAGRGTATASLNLYGREMKSLVALAVVVRTVYEPSSDLFLNDPPDDRCGEGGEALVAGLIGAFAVQAAIQQAIGVIVAATHRTADAGYLLLRMRAAETGATLTDAAAAVLAARQW